MLLIGLSWLMFFSHLRFQETMSDSLLLCRVDGFEQVERVQQ